jgi:hypothetical protein
VLPRWEGDGVDCGTGSLRAGSMRVYDTSRGSDGLADTRLCRALAALLPDSAIERL